MANIFGKKNKVKKILFSLENQLFFTSYITDISKRKEKKQGLFVEKKYVVHYLLHNLI